MKKRSEKAASPQEMKIVRGVKTVPRADGLLVYGSLPRIEGVSTDAQDVVERASILMGIPTIMVNRQGPRRLGQSSSTIAIYW